MSPWVKRIFTEILPRVLFMKRPELPQKPKVPVRTVNGIELRESPSPSHDAMHTFENVHAQSESAETECTTYYPPEVMEAIKGVTFIANHLRKGDEDIAVRTWLVLSCLLLVCLFVWLFICAHYVKVAVVGWRKLLINTTFHDPEIEIHSRQKWVTPGRN